LLIVNFTFFFPPAPAAPAFKAFGTLSFNLPLASDFPLSFAFSFSVFPYISKIFGYHL